MGLETLARVQVFSFYKYCFNLMPPPKSGSRLSEMIDDDDRTNFDRALDM